MLVFEPVTFPLDSANEKSPVRETLAGLFLFTSAFITHANPHV